MHWCRKQKIAVLQKEKHVLCIYILIAQNEGRGTVCTYVYDYMTLTGLIQAHDVISQVSSPCGGHDFDSSQVFADLDGDLAHLQCQLTGRHHDKCWGVKHTGDKYGRCLEANVKWTEESPYR